MNSDVTQAVSTRSHIWLAGVAGLQCRPQNIAFSRGVERSWAVRAARLSLRDSYRCKLVREDLAASRPTSLLPSFYARERIVFSVFVGSRYNRQAARTALREDVILSIDVKHSDSGDGTELPFAAMLYQELQVGASPGSNVFGEFSLP